MFMKKLTSRILLVTSLLIAQGAHAQTPSGFVGSSNSIDFSPHSPSDLQVLGSCYNNGNCTETASGTLRIYPKACDGTTPCTGCYAYQQGRLTRVADLNSAGTCDVTTSPRIEVLTLYRADCPNPNNVCTGTGKLSLGCRIRTIAGSDPTQNSIVPRLNQECFSGRPLVIDQLASTGTQLGGSCNGLKINIEGVTSPSPAMTSTARFDAKVFGGTGAITYQLWDDQTNTQITSPTSQALPGGQAGRRYTNLTAGRYQVRASDSSGCQVSATATICGLGLRVTNLIHQPVFANASGTVIPPSVAQGAATVSIDGYSINTMNGTLAGDLTWNVTRASGAAMPPSACLVGSCAANYYAKGWGVSSTSPFSGLPVDTYHVRVTDWNGCVAETKFEIEQKVQLCGSGMQPGSSGCVACPAGTYKSAPGNHACTSCGGVANGTITTKNASGIAITGAKSKNECKVSCNSPYVLSANGQSCVSVGGCQNLQLNQIGTEVWTPALVPTSVSTRWKLTATGGVTIQSPSISMARVTEAPDSEMSAPIIQYSLSGSGSGSGDPSDSTITAPPGRYTVTATAQVNGTSCTLGAGPLDLGPPECSHAGTSGTGACVFSDNYSSVDYTPQRIFLDPSTNVTAESGSSTFPNPGGRISTSPFLPSFSGPTGWGIRLDTVSLLGAVGPNSTCKMPLPGGWKSYWTSCWIGTEAYNWQGSYNRCKVNSSWNPIYSVSRIITNGACPSGTTANNFTDY